MFIWDIVVSIASGIFGVLVVVYLGIKLIIKKKEPLSLDMPLDPSMTKRLEEAWRVLDSGGNNRRKDGEVK